MAPGEMPPCIQADSKLFREEKTIHLMYIIAFIGSPCFLGREGICFLIPLLCKSPMRMYTYPDVKNLKAEREVLNSTKNQLSSAYMEKLLSPRQPRIMGIHFTPSSPSYLGSIHLFLKNKEKETCSWGVFACSGLLLSFLLPRGMWEYLGRQESARTGACLFYWTPLSTPFIELSFFFFFF